MTSAREAAVRIIDEMQIMSPQDSRIFAAALSNPRDPSEKLRMARFGR